MNVCGYKRLPFVIFAGVACGLFIGTAVEFVFMQLKKGLCISAHME